MSITSKFDHVSFNTISGYDWDMLLSLPEPTNTDDPEYLMFQANTLSWTNVRPFSLGYETINVQIPGRGQYLDVTSNNWIDFPPNHDLYTVEFTFYTNFYVNLKSHMILASLPNTSVTSQMFGTDIRFLFDQSQLRPIKLLINDIDLSIQPWTPINSLTHTNDLIGGNTRVEIVDPNTIAIVLDYDDAVADVPRDLALIEQFSTTIIRS